MDRTTSFPSPQRTAVLIMSHSDGHLEAFADGHADIRLIRVPMAFSPVAENIAEDVAELLIPRCYRALYRRDRLRLVGSTRPLLPTVLRDSLATRDATNSLNAMNDAFAPPAEMEVVTWML